MTFLELREFSHDFPCPVDVLALTVCFNVSERPVEVSSDL